MRKLLLSLIILFALIALPVGAQNGTDVVFAAEEVVDSRPDHSSSNGISETDTLTQRIFEGDPERSSSYSISDEYISLNPSAADNDISEVNTINNLDSLGNSSHPEQNAGEPYTDAEYIGMKNGSEQSSSEELKQTVNAFDRSEAVIMTKDDIPLGDKTLAPLQGEIIRIFEQSDIDFGNERKSNFLSDDGSSFRGGSNQINFTENDLIVELKQFQNGSVGYMQAGNEADISDVYSGVASMEGKSRAIRDPYPRFLSNLELIKGFAEGTSVADQNIGELFLEISSQLDILQNSDRISADDPTVLPYWRPFTPSDIVRIETPYIADLSTVDENDEPKNYAVVVGINQYSSRRNLRASVNDAEKMAQILRELYGYEVILLTDKTESMPPTKHNILEGALAEIKAKPNRGEVLVYFSGHGEVDDNGNFYLIPRDAGSNTTSYISEDELNQYIKDIKGLSLIVDACYSGGLYNTERQRRCDDPSEIGVEQGRLIDQLILRSSREDEPSNEMWNETNSVFTYYLCQAIKNEAKKSGKLPLQISLQSCFESVQDETVRWSSSHFMSQTPILTLA